jgi:hypothetical protein
MAKSNGATGQPSGTWVVTMTEPEALKGSSQTVRIWDQNGVVAASVQTGKFPPTNVMGILDEVGRTLAPDVDVNAALKDEGPL